MRNPYIIADYDIALFKTPTDTMPIWIGDKYPPRNYNIMTQSNPPSCHDARGTGNPTSGWIFPAANDQQPIRRDTDMHIWSDIEIAVNSERRIAANLNNRDTPLTPPGLKY